jgi:hypothetical protein
VGVLCSLQLVENPLGSRLVSTRGTQNTLIWRSRSPSRGKSHLVWKLSVSANNFNGHSDKKRPLRPTGNTNLIQSALNQHPPSTCLHFQSALPDTHNDEFQYSISSMMRDNICSADSPDAIFAYFASITRRFCLMGACFTFHDLCQCHSSGIVLKVLYRSQNHEAQITCVARNIFR